MEVLLQGTRFKPADAKAKGLVDELVATREDLLPAAKAWILEHRDDDAAAKNPWDRPGYKMPGGTPKTPALAAFLPAFPALLRKQTKGAVYPAQRAILSAAVEGAATDFDTASRIESRYLTNLIVNQQSKNMIQAFFFDLQAINAGKLRPQGIPPFRATKVGVLGAGMMGAGIAYACARAGMEVVLKDVERRDAEKGKAYSEVPARQGDRARPLHRGEEGRAARSDHPDRRPRRPRRLRPGDRGGLRGPAPQAPGVRRGRAVRERRRPALLQHLDAADHRARRPVSTGPPTSSACTSSAPSTRCRWSRSSRARRPPTTTLAKAYDVVQQIRKTPIVVNDSRGFYTSRVIGTMVNEGLAMLAEGVHPMSLERAATQAGYPVGPLQLTDELNMELMAKIGKANRDAVERDGSTYLAHPGDGGRGPDDRARACRRGSRAPASTSTPTAVARACGPGWPRSSRSPRSRDAVRGRQGAAPVRRGARDREVLRGGRHRVRGRRQHRLHHGHRLPAEHRWSGAVHDRLPGPGRQRCPDRPRRRSWRGPTRSRSSTATGSGPPIGSGRWRRTGSPSPPESSRQPPLPKPATRPRELGRILG